MDFEVRRIHNIIEENKEDLAFFIGNGINRYNDRQSERSWDDLLRQIYNEVSGANATEIPTGISLTEYYNIIELSVARGMDYLSLKKRFIDKLEGWRPGRHHNLISDKARILDVPILTINFDQTIKDSINATKYPIKRGKSFSDFYPWEVYFSNKEIEDPLSGFAIWHVNGMQDYPRSIKLGLTDYMGMIRKAHPLIHKNDACLYDGKDQPFWAGYKSWLHIIFNKSLFFFGLGLDEQEVFLRWLLIERTKYFRKFPERRKKGWYVSVREIDNGIDDGKRLFLEKLGIEILEVQKTESLYDEMWRDIW